MNRKIDQKLKAWKESRHRKPLIIRGARQVGKTYSISLFGQKNYSSCIKFDFEEESSTLHRIFEGDLTAEKIIAQLEVYSGQRFTPGETLIFFDEVQRCPRALMSLRYFYEQLPSYHVIAAGSMLEFALQGMSFPVGRVEFMWMFPMTFREFLEASDQKLLADQIPSRRAAMQLPESIHEKLLKWLKNYFLIGGLPEAVARFVETHSFAACADVHRSLYAALRQDLIKHQSKIDTACLERLFRQIPRMVGSQIKYSRLDPENRSAKVKAILQVMERALLITTIPSVSAQGLPLGADASDHIFKLLFVDIGLMQHICGIDSMEALQADDLLNVYQGALAEQFVGQELLAKSVDEHALYYWLRSAKNSSAEIDYCIVRDARIYPVEVKSEKAGRLRSMHQFFQEHPTCEKGYVLSSKNILLDPVNKLHFLPLYSDL